MNSFRRWFAGSFTLVAALILLPSLVRGQISSRIESEKAMTLVDPEKVPLYGTFWSVQRTNHPPMPFNPFPGLDVYYLGYGNDFLVDDSSVDFQAIYEEREVERALRQ